MRLNGRLIGFFVLAAVVLTTIAWARAPEYDEAYSLFLTAGHARPAWPAGVFTAGSVRHFYTGHAGLARLARDLRRGDVHPPLYFWALDVWRCLAGPSWLAARLLSVAFTLAGLWGLARLARTIRAPVLPALCLALFSYGFAYTGSIARGFALAQACAIAGVLLTVQAAQGGGWRRALAGGAAFGAACFSNYLALFPALAALAWLALTRPRRLPAAVAGFLPFMPACAWFFLAQRGTRPGQFAAFSLPHALALLARDFGAALFGGLPLYAGRLGMPVALALAALCLASLAGALRRWPPPMAPFRALLAALVLAPPAGLLALGALFGNTPIEIRYLAFSLPYLAVLLAAAPRPLRRALLAVQACAIAGLAFAPATMQPQAAAARLSAAVVYLPFGNDGVGIPGPFIAAAPDRLRIALLRPGDPLPARGLFVTLPIDNESRALAKATGCAVGVSFCTPR